MCMMQKLRSGEFIKKWLPSLTGNIGLEFDAHSDHVETPYRFVIYTFVFVLR